MALISTPQIKAFSRAGVILLRGVVSDWIQRLRQDVDVNIEKPGPLGREYLEPRLNARLNPGKPMAADEFPLVFQR